MREVFFWFFIFSHFHTPLIQAFLRARLQDRKSVSDAFRALYDDTGDDVVLWVVMQSWKTMSQDDLAFLFDPVKKYVLSGKIEGAELEKITKQTQAAWELNQERLTRSQAKLEAVQTSQEFQAVNKEIEQLKKLNLSLDEQKKKVGGEREVLAQEMGVLGEQLQKLTQEREAQSQVFNGQDRQLRGDLEGLLSERVQFIHGIEGRLLAQYER
ncbi:hypothetical protein EBT31_11815, partial [bacterium]|nr:hypothetical protein [bacterium]